MTTAPWCWSWMCKKEPGSIASRFFCRYGNLLTEQHTVCYTNCTKIGKRGAEKLGEMTKSEDALLWDAAFAEGIGKVAGFRAEE